MNILFGIAFLVAAGSDARPEQVDQTRTARHTCRKASAAKPVIDPNAPLAKTHGGKVWVTSDSLPVVEGGALAKWLDSHPTAVEITMKAKDDKWPINYVAVFKKAPAKGTMTVEFVDKHDPNVSFDLHSPQTPGSSVVYREGYDMDSNEGFSKGHTYVIRVGQLINKKFVSYATGEITLK